MRPGSTVAGNSNDGILNPQGCPRRFGNRRNVPVRICKHVIFATGTTKYRILSARKIRDVMRLFIDRR